MLARAGAEGVMSEKPEVVLLFHTSSHAIRAERILERAGIACRLTPVPRHFSSDCGVCVRVGQADREAAQAALAQARIETAGCHDL